MNWQIAIAILILTGCCCVPCEVPVDDQPWVLDTTPFDRSAESGPIAIRTFPAGDGCNTTTCPADGGWCATTLMACGVEVGELIHPKMYQEQE